MKAIPPKFWTLPKNTAIVLNVTCIDCGAKFKIRTTSAQVAQARDRCDECSKNEWRRRRKLKREAARSAKR